MDIEESLVLTVVLGSLMMFVLVLTIITFVVLYSKKILAKNNTIRLVEKNMELDLLRMEIETQESEREKIAANLHDEIGPLLSTHRLNLSLLIHDLNDGILSSSQIKEQQLFLDDVIESVRSVSHDLTPHFLLKMGLSKSLESYFFMIHGVEVTTDVVMDETRISKVISINTYRVILELVNNVLKYECPKVMTFWAKTLESNLEIKIGHSSEGLTNVEFKELAKNSKGLGLNSIQSRIIVLNADLNFNKSDQGSEISLIIPLSTHES